MNFFNVIIFRKYDFNQDFETENREFKNNEKRNEVIKFI